MWVRMMNMFSVDTTVPIMLWGKRVGERSRQLRR